MAVFKVQGMMRLPRGPWTSGALGTDRHWALGLGPSTGDSLFRRIARAATCYRGFLGPGGTQRGEWSSQEGRKPWGPGARISSEALGPSLGHPRSPGTFGMSLPWKLDVLWRGSGASSKPKSFPGLWGFPGSPWGRPGSRL